MTTPTVIKTTFSDIDSQNRQFSWTQYSDGSVLSREITRCTVTLRVAPKKLGDKFIKPAVNWR